MKKDYLFLLPFTIFIVLSAIIKPFFEDFMWQRIVASITVASFFFSFADLTRTQGNSMRKISEENLVKIDKSLLEISKIRTESSNDVKCAEENQNTYSLSSCNSIDKLEKEYLRAQSIMKRDLKLSSVLKSTFGVSAILGLLLLFFIISLKPFADFFMHRQDTMTILAFGFILLSQLLDGFVDAAKEYWNSFLDSLNQSLSRNIRKTTI